VRTTARVYASTAGDRSTLNASIHPKVRTNDRANTSDRVNGTILGATLGTLGVISVCTCNSSCSIHCDTPCSIHCITPRAVAFFKIIVLNIDGCSINNIDGCSIAGGVNVAATGWRFPTKRAVGSGGRRAVGVACSSSSAEEVPKIHSTKGFVLLLLLPVLLLLTGKE
jgi:hypothetical protein